MAIDIGCEAIDRATNFAPGYTAINKGNPANGTGIITSVEIYAYDNLSDCKVATFYTTNGNTLKCRDIESIGSVTAGSKQVFNGLSLDVQTGDYIGIYYSAGHIERAASGGSGLWFDLGNNCVVDAESSYGFWSDDDISLYGTGIAVEYLAGIVNGIATVTGNLPITKKLSGLASGVASVTGSLFVGYVEYLAGVVHGVATVTATLSIEGIKDLAGVISGACSVVGDLGVTHKLAGISAGVTSVVANLTPTGVRWLAGVVTGVARMQRMYEYYITNDDLFDQIADDWWRAQTFTPSLTHTITSVKLKLYRVGSPGTITVSIQGTNGSGHPDGNEKCSGTTDGDTLPTYPNTEWREIILGNGASLTATTKYAIVVHITGGNVLTQYLACRTDNSSPTYTGGSREYSLNGGSSWVSDGAIDWMFEEWGEGGSLSVTHKLAGTITGIASVVGNLTAPYLQFLAGVASGVCTVAGNLPVVHKLAGTSAGVAAVTGATKVLHKLAGVVAGVATVVGVLVAPGRVLIVKVVTTHYRKVHPVTTLYRTVKTATTTYRKVNPITTLYRKIKAFTGG